MTISGAKIQTFGKMRDTKGTNVILGVKIQKRHFWTLFQNTVL